LKRQRYGDYHCSQRGFILQDTLSFNHHELEQLLHAADAEGGASEAQGLLAGIICAGGKSEPALWLAHLLGENTLSAAANEISEQLTSLHTDILRQFNDDAFGFNLILPDDDTPLSVRTEALSQWCGGFLYGLALGGIREDAEMPANVSEVMKDFYEISHARFAYETTDDADEAAYMEIAEYVRMSVLLLHEELQPLSTTTRLQ
jgi:yecA family protein